MVLKGMVPVSSTSSNQLQLSEFDNEAYNEYKSRVFAQLASEYKNTANTQKNSPKCEQDCLSAVAKSSRTSFQLSLNNSTPHAKVSNNTHTLPHQKNRSTIPYNQPSLKCDKASRSESDLCTNNIHQDKSVMDWSSYEKQIKLISEKFEGKATDFSNTDLDQAFGKQRKGRKILYQKQTIDREAVRHKLSLGYLDQSTESSIHEVSANRLERSFSTGQSMQVCYINTSCSSSDNDSPPATPILSSPSFSPCVPHRPALHRMRSSTSPYGSNNTIISSHHHPGPSERSKFEELEWEARFQLAQAHQQVKAKAREERCKKVDNHSLIQKAVNGTLSREINLKLKSFDLKECDCKDMTIGQLRLIMNDMNRKKIELNDDLVALLVARDELRTEQDAKLVDVDDIKAMIYSIGPETTV